MWRVASAAGRPFPVLDDDPVIDYMIIEAVSLKVAKEDEEAQKAHERREWRKEKRGSLDHLRNLPSS